MLHEFVHPIIEYFSQHHQTAIALTFFIAFVESLPLIGTVIPGSILMTAIGTLIGTGIIPASAILLSATLGAFTGDCIGFAVGVYFQNNYRQIWPFYKYPRWMDASEVFFHRHGGKSVIIGRFIGPARSTVPMVAGLLKLSWPRFIGAAIPSAILWVIAYMLPGILLGAFALEVPFKQSSHFLMYGIIFIIGLWFIYWVCQRSFSVITAYCDHTIDKTWRWLDKHPRTHWITDFIQNNDIEDNSSQLKRLIVCAVCLILFLLVFLQLTHEQPLIAQFNSPTYYFLQSIRSITLDNILIVTTAYGNTPLAAMVTLCVLIALLIKHQWRYSYYLLGTMAVPTAITFLIKSTFTSIRPDVVLPYIQENSFPSGHTVISIILYGYIAFITRQFFPDWGKKVYVLASLLISSIIFSRIYLGAHWLTDILGGTLLASGLLISSILLYRRQTPSTHEIPSETYWAMTLVIALIVLPFTYTMIDFKKIQRIYQVQSHKTILTAKSWSKQPIDNLPIARLNRLGRPLQPFNIQWQDSLSNIRTTLLQSGWTIIQPYPTTTHSTEKIPRSYHLFSPLHHRKKPAIIATIKQPPSAIVELKLWSSETYVENTSHPIWIGTLKQSDTSQDSASKNFLTYLIPPILQQLTINHISVQRIQVPRSMMSIDLEKTNWDGTIIILAKNTSMKRNTHSE
ncbi:MAG: hypothetical protein CL816_02675 [Coxiellaceae bacterium]|nr:hypothetical protein [Coxiellaceae bacterium]|tara:strand:- start:9087 stop:11132 length:2046 start_codon:yes stop_codon:yes gene_type:complete